MALIHGRQPSAHLAERQAVLQKKQKGRADTEHHQRIAIGTIANTTP